MKMCKMPSSNIKDQWWPCRGAPIIVNLQKFFTDCFQNFVQRFIGIQEYINDIVLKKICWDWRGLTSSEFLICNNPEKLPYGVDKVNLKHKNYWNSSWSAAWTLKVYINSFFGTFWKIFCVSSLWSKKFQIGVIIWIKR